MKKIGVLIIEIIAIIAGLVAIFKILPNIEIAIGALSLTFGVLAIIWTSMAVGSLSKGSSLREYSVFFLLCLIFILIFSVINMLNSTIQNKLLFYLEYIFITIAYIIFVSASYRILKLGKEFGFREKTIQIKKKLKK